MKLDIFQFSHILFDIEGTVAPISFVHEVLFPYAYEKMESFINNFFISENIFLQIQKENKFDYETGSYPFLIESPHEKAKIIHYLRYLIQIDRKSTPLKEIQGEIWRVGYENGEIQSKIYLDALKFFKHIHARGLKASIYSSGSVLAQKLIFQYSDKGDLRNFFSHYFDTTIGPKKEKESYLKIAQVLELESSKIVFFTDVLAEAKAAQEAGIFPVILKRPTNPPQGEHAFLTIEDFYELI